MIRQWILSISISSQHHDLILLKTITVTLKQRVAIVKKMNKQQPCSVQSAANYSVCWWGATEVRTGKVTQAVFWPQTSSQTVFRVPRLTTREKKKRESVKRWVRARAESRRPRSNLGKTSATVAGTSEAMRVDGVGGGETGLWPTRRASSTACDSSSRQSQVRQTDGEY